MTVQVLMNKFSCAKEIYKIVIIRWSIAGWWSSRGISRASAAALPSRSGTAALTAARLRDELPRDINAILPGPSTWVTRRVKELWMVV